MKKEIDPRLVTALIAVVVIIVVFFGYREFGGSSSGNKALTPQQAGLGKPVLPSIPNNQPATNKLGTH